MTDTVVTAVAWTALVLHVTVLVAMFRSGGWGPWLPLLNLTTAGCVVGYWANRWYGYLVHGITWYASDQILPLYALLICVLSVMSLSGVYRAAALHWIAFVIHLIVVIGAVLFVTFFRMNRLF
jgi:hypothetical protein